MWQNRCAEILSNSEMRKFHRLQLHDFALSLRVEVEGLDSRCVHYSFRCAPKLIQGYILWDLRKGTGSTVDNKHALSEVEEAVVLQN